MALGTAAALGATAIGAVGGTGGGLLRDYLNSRYADNRAALQYGYDSQLAQQQFGYNSALSAQAASQEQNLARSFRPVFLHTLRCNLRIVLPEAHRGHAVLE